MKIRHLLLPLALLLSTLPGLRADGTIPKEQLKAVLDEMCFQMSGAPGMMFGIVSGDETALISYGETAKGNGMAWSKDTVWPVGSVSKVFTTQMLAAMVAEGEVKLSDPLSKFLPKGSKVPDMEGRAINLLDLATHSAGLPRTIITEEEYDKAGITKNPAYGMDRALKWLAENQLTHRPGTHYQYSNYGFGWLGQALAKQRGMTYGELVKDYYGKHGLKATSTDPKAAAEKSRASSIWMDGQKIDPDWVFNFEQPSGGVYSSGQDMLAFLKLCLDRTDPKQDVVNQIAHASYLYGDTLDNATTFSDSAMALGWEVDNPNNRLPVLLHKNGWVSGFNTWVIILPSEGIGIYSVSNRPYLEMKNTLENCLRMVMMAKQQAAKPSK